MGGGLAITAESDFLQEDLILPIDEANQLTMGILRTGKLKLGDRWGYWVFLVGEMWAWPWRIHDLIFLPDELGRGY